MNALGFGAPHAHAARRVAVCGAGAAGMAAAIACARAGVAVSLLEERGQVGGTMADTLLHTIAGLYDSQGNELNPGLPRELIERLHGASAKVRKRRMGKVWVLEVDPDVYRAVTAAWLASEPLIHVHTGTRVFGVKHESARVHGVQLSAAPDSVLPIASLVDATGDAAVLAAIDASLVRHERAAAGGWIFRMRGARPGTLQFPRNLAVVRALREAALAGLLPPLCRNAFVDSGVSEDEVFIKLLVPLASDWKEMESEISRVAKHAERELTQFLQTLEGFSRAVVYASGRLGVRDGGRALGEYVLTEADVLACRKFSDAACRAAWPIEYWDAERGAELAYLPSGAYYEIPERALKARSFENVWVAGKCLSADARAQASARTVGTCWAMGERSGLLSATWALSRSEDEQCA